AGPTKEPEKTNRARYLMAYCYYQSQRYYEAAVLAEFLARRYPQGGLSPKAAEMAMAALIDAYNTYTHGDRRGDLKHLIQLAEHTAETWPDADTGDAAKITLGDIQLGLGKYSEATKVFESVRSGSSRHPDALNKAGVAHWKNSLVLREREKSADA